MRNLEVPMYPEAAVDQFMSARRLTLAGLETYARQVRRNAYETMLAEGYSVVAGQMLEEGVEYMMPLAGIREVELL